MNVFGIDRMIKTLSTLHLSLGHLTPELASIASSILVSSSEALTPNQPNLIEDYFLEDEEEDIVAAIKRGKSTQGTVDRKRGVDVSGGGGVGEEGRLGVKGWNKVRRHLLPLLAAEVKVGALKLHRTFSCTTTLTPDDDARSRGGRERPPLSDPGC